MNADKGNVPLTGGAAGPGGFQELDQRVFVAVRTKGHPRPLELAVMAFSMAGNWGLLWLAMGAVLWLSGAVEVAGVFLLMPLFIYVSLLVNFIIKLNLKRERPMHEEAALKPLVGVPSSYSFPSSHAAMSLAAAVFMTHFRPDLWLLFYGLALVMSWTRVYVGLHYPSDVLAGMAVGWVTSLAFMWLVLAWA
ncbi:MAG: phosphatase PAP2 family protein [Thermoleophilia bacterium]